MSASRVIAGARAIAISVEFAHSIDMIRRGIKPLRTIAEQATALLARHAKPLPEAVTAYLFDSDVALSAIMGTGVYGRTLFDGASAPAPLGVAHVIWDANYFEFACAEHDPATVQKAVVGLAHDFEGRPLDCWAWSIRTGTVCSYFGRAGTVDDREALRPRIDEALTIHPTPLEWLQAGRAGIFVIDGRRAASILRDAGPLLADSIESGRALRDMLALPLSTIRVAVENQTRAAA